MKIDKELLKGCIPLMVLQLFRGGELYGYQIIKSIEALSGGAFSLGDGTLYPILHALERDGHIFSSWRESETGRKRKYYSLTDSGREYLGEKLREWDYFTSRVNLVLKGGGEDGDSWGI